jgi:hypothetical protein
LILLQAPIPQVSATSTSPQALQNRKPHKNLTTTGRPRGRPPNINKYLPHTLQQSGNMMNQFGSKSNFANYLSTSAPNRSMMNPYFMNPLVDTNMLSAILASGLSNNMMDSISAMSYFNQLGSYQDILRQYQNNFSLTNLASGLSNSGTTMAGINNVSTMSTSSSNISTSSNISNLSNLNNMTVKQLLNLNNSMGSTSRPTSVYHQMANKTSNSTMSMTKDRPNISITPVSTSMSQQSHHKAKLSKQLSSQTESTLPVQIPKSLQISPTKSVLHPSSTAAQVSLLKPSIIQQVKTSPPKQMNVPQIRVSKSLTEPQPAHNPALSHSPLKNNSGTTNTANIPQIAHASISAPVAMKQQQVLPMSLSNVPRSGTSLQHKLLSKKNSQRSYLHTSVQSHSIRKAKTMSKTGTIPIAMSGSFPNLLNTIPSGNSGTISQSPFIPPELSGISVSTIGSQLGTIKGTTANTKYHNYKKSTGKTKSTTVTATTAIELPASSLATSFPQNSSVDTFSMLSQLQQHSHLEIIPQQKAQLKPNIDYPKNLSSSVNIMPQKVSETLRSSTATECMPMYDISRGKSTNISNKKAQDKLINDSVEIITLDD